MTRNRKKAGTHQTVRTCPAIMGCMSCEELVADCRIRLAADVLGPTWNPVVLAALREGPMRRAALRRAIGGISDKVLTQTLARLSDLGLVAADSQPGHAMYRLTELGETFADGPLRALGDWAVVHGDALAV